MTGPAPDVVDDLTPTIARYALRRWRSGDRGALDAYFALYGVSGRFAMHSSAGAVLRRVDGPYPDRNLTKDPS